MLQELKQFTTQQYCLDCRGCCRFKKADSPWRPKVYTKKEKEISKECLDAGDRITTRLIDGEHQCSFLDGSTNRCRVYSSRPLECLLYPFIFVKDGESLFLSVHLACPFVQEAQLSGSLEEYTNYLRQVFDQSAWQEFFKDHSRDILSAHIHDDEIKKLFCVLLK